MRPFNVQMVTPVGKGSLAGNRATATRWARMLRREGLRVTLATEYSSGKPDLMIALHAWRSYRSIERFRRQCPDKPLIVALTGTDIYRFQRTDPEETVFSMEVADALIGLHDRVRDDIPNTFHEQLHTVFQSAEPLPCHRPPVKSWFDVCVVGHLREEKDSLRTAWAALELPSDSRVRVIQAGKAHNDKWRALAEAEMLANQRYQWRGEIPRWQVRRLMAQSRAMVISSVMEGGANVVSEACVAGLPVIASDIPGNRGLLGEDYPGYYPVGNTAALAGRLSEIERNPDYLERLRAHCEHRASLFTEASERQALVQVVNAVRARYGIQ